MLASACVPLWSSQNLRYERSLVAGGEWWRLLTANFTHLGWGHALLNLAAFALLLLLLRRHASPLALVSGALGSTGGLYLFSPEITWYVGLSGALHGLFLAGALRLALSGRRIWWWGLLLLAAKITYELGFGSIPGSSSLTGGEVVAKSHLYGAVAAIPFGFRYGRSRAPKTT